MRLSFLGTTVILFIFRTVAYSQDPHKIFPEPQIQFNPKHYVCYKTEKSLNINGELDDNAWQNADWTDYFVDIEGEIKHVPRLKTRAKMLWDDKYFYIAAEMEDPDVWATLRNRDAVIFQDNDFEVFIDPDGDTHNYYELEINAFNTQWDLFLIKPYRDAEKVALDRWDMQGLKSAVSVNGSINNANDKDIGWSIEIAIPWAALKEFSKYDAPPKNGDQWRVNFSRVQWRLVIENDKYKKEINPETNKAYPEDNWVWSPQGVIAMHYPEMWGFVQFSKKASGSAKDEFRYNKRENAKWVLRQVYYKEKPYFMNYGNYTDDFVRLGLPKMEVVGYQYPPNIECTQNTFEAILISNDGKNKITIYQDGFIK